MARMKLGGVLGVAAAGLGLVAACGDDDGGAGQRADAGPDAAVDASDGEGGAVSTHAACSRDRWCWELPRPQGNTLRGAWAAGPGDLWFVGDSGTVLHHDGKGWSVLDAGTREDLLGVWGSPSGSVWAVGSLGTVLRWNGSAWAKVTLPTGADAGADAAVTTTFHAVHGTQDSNVWIVGEGGSIWHYDGTSWTSLTNPMPSTLRAVFAATTGKAWAASEGGHVLEWNGSEWSVAFTAGAALTDLDGTADGSAVVAVGAGGTFATNASGTWKAEVVAAAKGQGLRAAWVETPDRVWAFGDSGLVLRWEAAQSSWVVLSSGTDRTLLTAARVAADEVVAAGQSGVLLRWKGEARSVLSSGTAANRLALGGTGPGDVWVVGDDVLHGQGDAWLPADTGTPRALYDVAARSKDDVWAVGTGGTVLHYTGEPAGWQLVPTGHTKWLRGIAVSPSGGWVVGEQGSIFAMINGTSWVAVPSNTTTHLNDVFAVAPDDAWAVGENGLVLRWDGGSWSSYPVASDGATLPSLRAVWGSGPSDVYAVGVNGTVLHYDGKLWTLVRSGEKYSLNDVWGSSGSDVYVVGTSGVILHFDGSEWKEQDSGVAETLNAVWGTGPEHVLVAGEGGALLRRVP